MVGGKHAFSQPLMQCLEPPAGAADPSGERRTREIDAVACKDLRLPIKRRVIAVFADQHLGEQRRRRQAAGDHPLRSWRLHHRLAATHGAKDRALRHTRRAPCRSSSSPPHACSGTREAQSDRCPYARCSDCAEASWACSTARSSAAVPAFSGAISTNLPYACADPPRSPDGAPTASNLPSKDRVSGSSASRQERFHTKPQHGSTRTGCRPLPRNDEAPSEILHCSREAEMEREQNIRKMCRTRTVTQEGE
jgi:hypothetical protein